ncbi:conserved hypothetical protein [[Clostridium] saccharolyticum WM1]|uniref:Lipoprotein n=2 Tax=Lacrimispora TaxID=2719231 RepID=D9R0Y5_LACSW|nr:hypothetical protein [Lacrimispora saccharolytica]ADL02784.1 conserved hypothetical protein [[Clostridium] saccharolyticum WM1]
MKHIRKIMLLLMACIILTGCKKVTGASSGLSFPQGNAAESGQSEGNSPPKYDMADSGPNDPENPEVAGSNPYPPDFAGPAPKQPPENDGNSPQEGPADSSGNSAVDIDLSKLSSTMVFSEVYYMMTSPEQYMGKSVKAEGTFQVYQDPGTKKNYYAVVIADATACCQQGLEFIWNGEHTYPDDYPEQESEIEITGVFQSYQEEGSTYYYLLVDEVKPV